MVTRSARTRACRVHTRVNAVKKLSIPCGYRAACSFLASASTARITRSVFPP